MQILSAQHVQAIDDPGIPRKCVADGGIWPAIPNKTPTVPLAPKLLPIILQRYKYHKLITPEEPRLSQLTIPPSIFVKTLRLGVSDAYDDLVEKSTTQSAGAHGGNFNKLKDAYRMFFYSQAPLYENKNIGCKMVVPFHMMNEAIVHLR